MFLAIIFIALGVAILLNALGMFNATFFGIFWGIFFVVIGIKLMIGKRRCCGWGGWRQKFHQRMHEECHCGGHCDNHEENHQ